jgi:hypothetical protein
MKHENRYLHGFSFDRLFGELALASTLPRPTSPFLGMVSLRSAFTGAPFATAVPSTPLVKHAVVFDAVFGFTASTALVLPAHVTKNICYCKT